MPTMFNTKGEEVIADDFQVEILLAAGFTHEKIVKEEKVEDAAPVAPKAKKVI